LAGVETKQKKKLKVTTDSKHKLPVAPSVLDINFVVSLADGAYCFDITYILTKEGSLYVAIVIDIYSRKVLKWLL
jgi:transposase InsO family protein